MDSDSNMLYSVFVESKPANLTIDDATCPQNKSNINSNHIIPRKLYKWVEDDSVSACYNTNCQIPFSLLVRRHHCRLCGRIFCYNCTENRINIPAELLSDDSKRGSWNDTISSYIGLSNENKHRVCIECKLMVEFISSVKKLIDVFIILKLDLKDLKKASIVCKSWNNASNYIRSIFREIQYKLPISISSSSISNTPQIPQQSNNSPYLTNLERKLLWLNSKYLSGHSKYLVQLFFSCRSKEEYEVVKKIATQRKTISCWSMMCTRNCKERLSSFDAINLICHSFNRESPNEILRKIGLDYLRCTDKEFKCYLPILVYYLRFDKGIVADFLIEKCNQSPILINALYWELQLYPNDEYHMSLYMYIINKFKELLKSKSHEVVQKKIQESSAFVKTIEAISKNICDDNLKYDQIKDDFKLNSLMTNPLAINSKIKTINIDGIKLKDSATKPLYIPCTLQNNLPYNILYKKEDIRKDQMIMNMIYLISSIVKQEENIDLELITYNILPLNSKSGLIEMIHNSETIYFIQEKMNTTILNFILESNEDNKIKEVRDRFMKTIAAYSVITYLLGIGDRHLDNIMITKDGRLFHIDFGYILGNDPIMSNPGIKITTEMVDALGGINSKAYQKFTDLCTKIYNCLRRHIDLFINMLSVLPNISDIGLDEEAIRNVLIKRFSPGATAIEAKLHLVSQIDRQSYTDKIKDWCHYHSKEKTIANSINKIAYSITSLIRQNTEQK